MHLHEQGCKLVRGGKVDNVGKGKLINSTFHTQCQVKLLYMEQMLHTAKKYFLTFFLSCFSPKKTEIILFSV